MITIWCFIDKVWWPLFASIYSTPKHFNQLFIYLFLNEHPVRTGIPTTMVFFLYIDICLQKANTLMVIKCKLPYEPSCYQSMKVFIQLQNLYNEHCKNSPWLDSSHLFVSLLSTRPHLQTLPSTARILLSQLSKSASSCCLIKFLTL
jgi:hypothetical protein